jgi:hypothetical protein
MDTDSYTTKLKRWRIVNRRVAATETPIRDLMGDMASIVGNGLPCPSDDKLALHTPKVYNELLKEAKVKLSNVMNKRTIPLPLEVINQLHPSIATLTFMKRLICSLPPIDHIEKTELNKSFRILKSVKAIKGEQWW